MLALILSAFTIGVAVAAPPGAVVISGSQRAVTHGFRSAFNFYMGSFTADTLYALMVYFGVSALVAESIVFKLLLWTLGGAWLIWMGWDAIRSRADFALETTKAAGSFWHAYRAGLFITLLNPLTIIGWIALAGNFFNTLWRPDWPPVASAGLIAVLVMLAGVLAWVLGLALVLSAIRHRISPAIIKAVSVASGLLLIAFGLGAWWSALDLLV
jgi:threonine/homoserine/homoserine lactone efflux protein